MSSPLLRPWMRAMAEAALPADLHPLPSGEPVVRVDGPDPDRVLVVGGGPAAGVGASSHAAALPGVLARALVERTGRGAVVECRAAPRVRLAELGALLEGAQLQRFDALVLVVGMLDAARGDGVRDWERRLRRHLDAVQHDGARGAAVVLSRIPPASSVLPYRGPAAVEADRQARRMNRVLARAARQRAWTAVADQPVPDGDAPFGSGAWYERSGAAYARVLAPLLAAQPRA